MLSRLMCCLLCHLNHQHHGKTQADMLQCVMHKPFVLSM